ncbi:hypothetical protein [Pajaroellobacter abortibovis]|uniref:DUF4390 domain-containing protein n=1 Tax=Pajaroellobacter abortibovis TaxID=1882918 RepID=A0A1L6MW69_9BACT|nr:hypothetical protein [Pajaroellobacter abortibovis]APR99766.1 hypothetical protein BCY86_03050 [Pajaroellobacter abortibovis]
MREKRHCRWFVLLFFGLQPSALKAADTSPQDLPLRSASFRWDGTLLRVSFSYRDLVDGPTVHKLVSGIPVLIRTRVDVIRKKDQFPVAFFVYSCHVVYDLWDEVYRITISQSGRENKSAALGVEGILHQCAEGRDWPIVSRTLLKENKTYFLRVLSEIDPTDPELLAEVRRWIGPPLGTHWLDPGGALFASFAKLFVRKIGGSERHILFRTPPLPH